MVLVQINLSDEEDRMVEIFKAENRIDTKENTIKEMIKRSGKWKHKFELVDKHWIGTPNMRTSRFVVTQRCVYCGELKKDNL